MSDLLARIDVYLTFAATSTAAVLIPAGCDPPWKLLQDAKVELTALQAVAGVVAPGDDLATLKAKGLKPAPKTEFPDWMLEPGAGLV